MKKTIIKKVGKVTGKYDGVTFSKLDKQVLDIERGSLIKITKVEDKEK